MFRGRYSVLEKVSVEVCVVEYAAEYAVACGD